MAQIPHALKNSVWSLFEYVWNPLLILLTTPFFLHALGTGKFGVWMFLNATVGFGGILTAGIVPPVVKRISTSIALQDQNAIKSTIREALSLAITGGIFGALLLLIVFVFFGDTVLSKIGNRETVLLLGVIAAVVLLIDQFDAVFVAVLKGAERYDKSAKIEIIARTVLYIVAAISVQTGCGFYGIFAAQIVAAVYRLSVRFYNAKEILPIDDYAPDFTAMRDFTQLAKWGWIQGVGNALYSIADRFILGTALGAASLAHYTVASQLAIQIQAVAGALLSVLFPVISRSIAAGRLSDIARITSMTLAGSWCFVSAACLALLYWRMEILTLWVGRDMAIASQQILFYLTIATWVQGLTVAPHFVLLGFGKFRLVAITGLLGGVISAVIMVSLVSQFGEQGVGVGRIAYGVAMCIYFIPLVKLVYNPRSFGQQSLPR